MHTLKVLVAVVFVLLAICISLTFADDCVPGPHEQVVSRSGAPCAFACETGYKYGEIDTAKCVPKSSSCLPPTGEHLVLDTNYQYPNCVYKCDKGYQFNDQHDCVPIASESGTSGESSGQIQVVTPQGTTSGRPGDKIQVTGQAKIKAKCEKIGATLDLIKLVYDDFGERLTTPGISELSLWCTILFIDLNCRNLLSGGKNLNLKKVADSGSLPTSSSTSSPVKMEIELQQGPLRAEVVNDQVSLNVDTPTTAVSSEGQNTFGVAYDPNSGKSFVAAYQNPLLVKPSNSNQAPFTLGSGQQVEVNSNGIGPITTIGQTTEGSTYISPNGKDMYGTVGGKQGGCHTDPSTGVVTCIDTISDFSNPEGSNQGSLDQGGCHTDPATDQMICVERISDFSNPTGSESVGSGTVQSGTVVSVPSSLQECETYTSAICGTWTLQGDHINAVWDNGAKATLNVEQFDDSAVVITRQDTEGSSAGLTARYEGRPTGNHVEGSVTWNWKGSTWRGTWKADW